MEIFHSDILANILFFLPIQQIFQISTTSKSFAKGAKICFEMRKKSNWESLTDENLQPKEILPNDLDELVKNDEGKIRSGTLIQLLNHLLIENDPNFRKVMIY